ncbi:hypothetical protein [Chryseobacterium sp.]|uniref:hypothetical protein n=1 Tax=Chryseobacterium sp. TaxID=1871047 RepID=UPI0011C7F1B8|nr:hypothetical protein [Chryseobacterium sp.]TXF77328.1 hypothetical protein FUA25_05190 [Chryseobacterium sp.]
MKKTALLLAFVLGLVSMSLNAQTSTDNVTLNVRLYPIQTIVINPLQKPVNLDYTTAANYTDGVSVSNPDHLKIYSTGGFTVTVASSTTTLTNSINSIPASDITITPTAGTTNTLSGATLTAKTLGTTASTIIDSSTGGFNKNFDIKYGALGAGAYMDKYSAAQGAHADYTTTVTYTIAAK